MTTHQVYASKIAVSDDGSRTLKRTKKTRVNEKSGSYAVQNFFASRASIVALLFVIALNLQLHFKRSDTSNIFESILRSKRFAECDGLDCDSQADSHEVIAVEPTFTPKFMSSIQEGGPQCSPSPVVFVKTHKTGGTTITNMILRHAERNNMLAGLPIQDHWELAGYPASFDSRLIDPLAKEYQVLCHHFRYNEEEIAKKVPSDAVYVTIMRNPISNYESIFGFFRDYPFAQWVGRNGTLKTFLSDPAAYYDRSTPWYFRAKNYMAYDLGFDNENSTAEYTRDAITKLDSKFDLVMITDRFEESIILMKEILCMSDEDVIYLALKVRRETQSTELTTDEAKKIREWNALDTALYDHFEKKLDMAVERYGRDRMSLQVNKLREQLRDVEEKCVDTYAQQRLTPWIRRIKLRRKSGDQCLKMTWGEVKFADHIRDLQSSRSDLPPQPSFIRQHLLHHDVQRTVLGESPYIHADLML